MAEQLYQSTKRRLINKYGRDALSNIELDQIGNDMFGNKYMGTFYYDKLPKMPANKFAIVNTAKYPSKGIHWIAAYSTPNNQYMWDSYKRNAKQVLHSFNGNGKNIISANVHDIDQQGSSEICGILCMSWLNVVDKFGIREAIKKI